MMAFEEKTGAPIRNTVVPTQREIQEYIDLLGTNPFGDLGG